MTSILTVSELTSAIKSQLESRFSLVSVRGEISNLKEQSSGHLYFTLKDNEAQLSAVMFKGAASQLSRIPKGGDQVVVKGEISVYAPRGNYQIIIRALEYQGTGQLLLRLHELKKELSARGWFDSARKKKLPKFPKTIGVITSPTGAVIQDILTIASRRHSGIHLILNPVKVQGEGAAQEIAQAISQFNRFDLADLLIVGRGGGSLEDLWAFNEECVAKAIFESKIPIISAVGHETDVTIADFVADIRAPTPSAAAELAIGEKTQQLQFLKQTHLRLTQTTCSLLAHHKKMLERTQKAQILTSPYPLLGTYAQTLDGIREDIDLAAEQLLKQHQFKLLALAKQATALKPSSQIQMLRDKLFRVKKALDTTAQQNINSLTRSFNSIQLQRQLKEECLRIITEKKQRLNRLISHLQSIDPKNLLTKGYCILFQENKESVILSLNELSSNDRIRIRLHDGTAHATINETFP
ncbi:MAG: exodeoxyribonuclease VII large subunit [Rhabdochlamydiaceae bacterium]|nr:exodeoxyribonuclease VII large subunit [Rhabdochlamydiaceae bacterium]